MFPRDGGESKQRGRLSKTKLKKPPMILRRAKILKVQKLEKNENSIKISIAGAGVNSNCGRVFPI